MSMLDVKKYYLDVHKQYTKMEEYMDTFKEEYKKGTISEEQAEDIRDNYEILKANYDRLSYIMYLFNIPKSKKNQKKKQDSLIKEKMYVLSHAGKDVVVNENTDVLKAFEAFQKHLKEQKEKD